ncbi:MULTISPECIES: hypothetical protein [Nocardia]|uniref:hypothetical protein n=1 Tax=Nocardia TaxID=1817 RepID=UPI001C24B9E7|nr:hypothetical protein [Nocardia noduli]
MPVEASNGLQFRLSRMQVERLDVRTVLACSSDRPSRRNVVNPVSSRAEVPPSRSVAITTTGSVSAWTEPVDQQIELAWSGVTDQQHASQRGL